MLEKFELIVGTYEEFLLGYEIVKEPNTKKLTLKQSFATHDHTGAIKSVSTSNRYAASGGYDDRVFVYDMVNRKLVTVLNHHFSPINSLEFSRTGSHLLIGSQNGAITIVRAGNWQVEKSWPKAHKDKSVLCIRVHKSSKLALSLGADTTLRTWNLIKGRQGFAVNLNKKCEAPKSIVGFEFAQLGSNRFLMFGAFCVQLWSLENGGILHSFKFDCSVSSICWIDSDQFFIGFDSGLIKLKSCKDPKVETNFELSDSRIKVLKKISKSYFVAGTSSGKIYLLLFKNGELKTKSETNTNCRITSLTFLQKPTISDIPTTANLSTT